MVRAPSVPPKLAPIAKKERAHVERVHSYRERLRQEGLLLQQKGIAWLQTADGAKVGEAVRAIGEGFRLEALGLGEATDRVALEATYDDTFERLSDDELAHRCRTSRSRCCRCPASSCWGRCAP